MAEREEKEKERKRPWDYGITPSQGDLCHEEKKYFWNDFARESVERDIKPNPSMFKKELIGYTRRCCAG